MVVPRRHLLRRQGAPSRCRKKLGPPEEGLRAASQRVIPMSIVRATRGYIERIANQANGAYDNGWYDACAVMIRRLLETLIIEAFEHEQIADKIKNSAGGLFLPQGPDR